ncbi:MAG: GNAT family N-acetyltransferase [Candidatus Pacebacteria bacterium]|nr:GNAT family N-acetyltransferase [Candidatus Paceibacterota bacterium]
MAKNKKILVVAAHPDDEVLGCGATIARHTAGGDTVWVLILGEGIASRSGIPPEEKEKMLKELHASAEKASKILGVEKLILKNLPDNKLDTVPLLDIIKMVEGVVAEFKPDIIYTHNHSDLNVDHRLTVEAVALSIRPVEGWPSLEQVLSFEVPSSTEWNFIKEDSFKPNVFVDISNFMDKKIDAMNAYETEFRKFPHPRSLEYVGALAVVRGGKAGMMKAEAFSLIYERKTDNDKKVVLRKAVKEDEDFIFRLRNEEAVRNASFDSRPIDLAVHKKWFEDKLASAASVIYVAEADSVPAGMVRFDETDESSAGVNIAITENYRGKGYGKKILAISAKKYFEDKPDIKNIYAYIKPDNRHSVEAFSRAGYEFDKETVVVHKGMICVKMKLTRRQ